MTEAGAVAVVGIGCVYPGAPDAESFWANVVAGVDSITDAPADRIDPCFFSDRGGSIPLRTARGGFVEGEALAFEPGRFGIMPVTVEGAEPDQMMAIKTAAAALDDTDDLDGVPRDRIGVILGRGGYLTPGLARLDQRVRTNTQLFETLAQLLPEIDQDRIAAVKDAFTSELGELHPESAIGLVPNLAASRIANRFDLGGPAYTIDAACASSLVAVDAAIAELTSGRCDAVLAGGVHHCHDVTLWSVFSQLGALSASGEIRPFSRRADGILVSEGTGIVVLERLVDAVSLNHQVYAIILGTGVASDGRSSSLMSPRVDGQVLALERAYRAASVDPASVGLLEGHGTATPTGDRAELESIRNVYGNPAPAERPRPVLGSVKSNIGHAMPAAGAAGLIKSVLAVYHGVLPPTLHADDPNPAVAETRFRIIEEAESWSDPPRPRRSAVNAFGFGGVNAHVIVEQYGCAPKSTRSSSARPSNTVRSGAALPALEEDQRYCFDAIVLEGRDPADVASQLRRIPINDGVRSPSLPISRGPARFAIVDPTPKKVELAARALDRGQPWRGRNDVWFEPEGLVSSGGRVAFLFPGIEPTSHAELDDVARWFGVDTTPVPEAARGIERQARETFASGRLLDQALTALGVTPDDIVGHSLGEWTGLFSAQLIPPDRGATFLEGLEPGKLELPGVVFLALGCGSLAAAAVISDLDGVVVSHDNCPHQSIVCGPEASIVEARRRFADRKVLTQELPFRSGFHTPYLVPYLDVVRHHWERMPLQEARIPLWSATTCERYPPEADAVRQLAVDHLVKPVRFRELLERLHADGVRVFVQMGVGSLISFADDTLKDRPHLSISAASLTRPGLEQLARAAVALWVEGVDVHLEKLLAPIGTPNTAGKVDERHGPTVRLSLGTPLVRLPDSITLGPIGHVASTTSEETISLDRSASPAVRAEFEALLAEARSASESVAAALASSSSQKGDRDGSAVLTHPKTASASNNVALAETISKAQLFPQVSEEILKIGIESFPWLVDHCFYRQPEGWPELSDRFPVVPMTTMVELIAEAAARLVPDMTITRIEGARALRWLVGDPPTEVRLSAKRVGTSQVEAVIQGYAKAMVHFATSCPPSPASNAAPLLNPRLAPASPETLYTDHWMFHGPSFQGVRSIDSLGDNGIDGSIECLSTQGAWLDNAGQLYGLWLMATAESDLIAFPQSIDLIEFFGKPPPPGGIVTTAVRIVDVGPRNVRADIELMWNGALTVRITGWVDRRFDSDPPLWVMLREPEHHLVATHAAEGYVAVEERWSDSASRELMARRYLDAAERVAYGRLNPREQRLWLLGRIAAKDAIRHALWSEGHGPLFPIEVPLVDHSENTVVVSAGPGRGRRVALAQAPWVGVAATDSASIGVECVQDGDRTAARLRLEARLAASRSPMPALHTDVLSSPVHLVADPRNAGPESLVDDIPESVGAVNSVAHRKEYIVCRTASA